MSYFPAQVAGSGSKIISYIFLQTNYLARTNYMGACGNKNLLR